MPRPTKRSTIAKRLYAQRCASTEAAPLPLKITEAEFPPLPLKKRAEAARPPLKTYKAEVTPLPRKKMADCSGSCNPGPTQQVPPRPAKTNGKEAATLPLKISQAKVMPTPCKKKGRFCHRVETTPQQVPPLPVGTIGVEAKTLPLKTSRAEVMPHPRIKKGRFCHRVETNPQQVPPLPVGAIGVEANTLPLKTSRAEVMPHPRKKIGGFCHCVETTPQQVPPLPVNPIGVEAAPLPLKTSQAEVVSRPRPKVTDKERLCSMSEISNQTKPRYTLPISVHKPSIPVHKPSIPVHSPSISKRFPLNSNENKRKSSKQCFNRCDQSVKSSRQSAGRFVIPTKSMDNDLNTLNLSFEFPQKSVLTGSFDQADARFGDLRNRQCGAISLTAVLRSKLKNVLTWSTQDLDGVLVAGTHLYESLRKQGNIKDREVKGRNYIAVHELPRRHMLGNTTFSIEYSPSLTGFVNVNEYHAYDKAISGVAMPLDVALQQALLSADAFLLTVCANTSAVIKQGSWYAVVDSHAIKTETSCVTYHRSVESLYNYINDMAQLFGEPEPPFEITGVLVYADAEVCDPLEEAAGSSFPCTSGKALYSEVLKRSPKVCESVKSEVKPSDFQVDSGKLRQPQMKHPMKTQPKSMKKPIQTEQNIPANCHESALSACCDFPQKSMLKGSFDQADARFGDSRNRQCGAISLTAVLRSKLKNVLTWSTQDLDSVLVAGTRLYESLRKQGNIKDRAVKGRNYIAVHELPRRHMLGNTTFSIEYTPSLTGFVNVNEYHEYDQAISAVAMPLDVALQQTLLSADAFLLTICANTSAVIKQGSWYAVVDSHAIRTDTSCVVYHSTIESLYNYINDMAQLFGEPEPPFEITGVLVHADAEVSDPLQEAGSSSLPCSSGKALYSDVLKRTPKVRESVKTEPKTPDCPVPVDEVADVRNPNLPTQTVSNVLPSKGKRLRKEKHIELSGKRVTKSHAETVVTDDLMITDVSVPDVFFSPLTHNDKQALCELIQMSSDNSDHNVINFGPISAPCQTKTIKPDGNCFFRSLAHVICGSEEKHLKVRRAVVKHLKMNTPLFERYVRSEYSSAEDYLTRSRMFYSGSWVTEIDIFVAADLFKTTIMTFNDGRWNAHKPNGEAFTQNAIYLKHCNRNHYEVVTCVKHRDRDSVCAGACGNVVSNEVSKPCLRKRKVSDAEECCPTKRHRDRYRNDSEYRQKQLKYEKAKYGNDPEYRQNKIEHAKAKYCDGAIYRGKKIEYAKTKYSV
ncbi:uncharacterized protein LOC128011045 [Carassius gibelio]|uniref:uncharacterized protein LOC128011045 n=1 Tax=Carassius gibelio TaxID=101364 RepID=UPI0022776E38|nr:uncharacterized protein LOC128011045 [Carassius gibelio]